MKNGKRIWQVMALAAGLAISLPAFASLSQGYATTKPIPSGSLVSLDDKSSGSVVICDLNTVSRLFGVAVPPSSASVSLSGAGSGQVQVVTSGTANVLVSTAGGNIRVGDYITVSSLAGVGQKVGETSTRVIGTASAGFDGTGTGATKSTVGTGDTKSEVSIGVIPVIITASAYTSTGGRSVVPSWLQNATNSIAGKPVSPARLVLAGLILFFATTSITVLLYAAVRNSIISIGRNPLSRASVMSSLARVAWIALGILALSSGAMYLVIAR